ncbi:MAG: amidase [Gemmatimonadaceae bacterium]
MRDINRRQFLATTASGAAAIAAAACVQNEASKHLAAGGPAMLTLHEASLAIRNRTISPVELTQSCLDRISRLDGKLNAFITINAEQALADARNAEHEILNGKWRGPMHGIPIGLKDNIDTAGIRTTAGSAAFDKRIPTADAAIVKKLKDAGAIVVGKLNMHEFALGTTSAISHYGAVHNPWNVDYIAGGSSGGCGAAVAANFVFGAVGTDTGGSIRVPASACGIVGLKPTYDVVNSDGVVPVSRLFDHVGPMCRTVGDTALMMRAMTDNGASRAYNTDSPPSLPTPRLGIVKNTAMLCETAVDGEVQAIFDKAVAVLRTLVTHTFDVDLPMPVALGELIEADLWEYHHKRVIASPEMYDARTANEITKGKSISPAHRDSLRAGLEKHRFEMRGAFMLVDVVVHPTLPTLPIRISDALAPFSQGSCTFEYSLAGLPSLSVPCGMSSSGLPVGMLISGPPFAEARLFGLAAAYEKATKWHTMRPAL